MLKTMFRQCSHYRGYIFVTPMKALLKGWFLTFIELNFFSVSRIHKFQFNMWGQCPYHVHKVYAKAYSKSSISIHYNPTGQNDLAAPHF